MVYRLLSDYPSYGKTTVLKDVKIIGDSDCFDSDEFFQYVLAGDKLYRAYFSLKDEDGNPVEELDHVDYCNAYRIEDITDFV